MNWVGRIHKFLDLFYPLVRKIFDKATYYYAVAGSMNLILGWLLFWLLDKIIFVGETIWVPILEREIHTYTVSAAICAVFSFLFGFVMMKFVVFTKSSLTGGVQFFRYGISALISGTVNWLLIKLMVSSFKWDASLCNVFASVVVVAISYFLQRKFSFK